MTWRMLVLDAHTGLFIPRLVTWDPETGEFTRVEGPKGFETWEEAEEAGRFLQPRGIEHGRYLRGAIDESERSPGESG